MCCQRTLRHFGFQADKIDTEAAGSFRAVVKHVCGMTGKNMDAMLTSLGNELAFNTLRDAGRRHKKAEKTVPENLHSVACKSVWTHPMGASTLELEEPDWQVPLTKKAIKASIFSSLRTTDASLGINGNGLTKRGRIDALTKPHIFCQRLELFQCLREVYEQCPEADEEKKADAVAAAYCQAWVSRLIPQHWFIAPTAKVDSDNASGMLLNPSLVIRAGPHDVVCLDMSPATSDKCFGLSSGDFTKPKSMMIPDLKSHKVAASKPVVDKRLCWEQSSPWMSICDCVADVTIKTLSGALVGKLCSQLGLKGHSKLDHRHKVMLFLQHMRRSEEYIQEVMDALPERKRKKAIYD